MAFFRDTPIRRKLMTMILVTSGVVLLLTCAAFVGSEPLTFRRNAVQQLATFGEVIAAESTGALAFENQRDATEILAALKAERHIVAACLYDKEGKIFSRYPADASDAIFPPAPEPDGYRFADGRLVGFTPVVQLKGSDRFGTLYLSSDMGAMYERLRLYGGIALVVVVVASLVAMCFRAPCSAKSRSRFSRWRKPPRPVSDRHDYSVRAGKHGDDELGVLTDAFNHMLAQIQEQNEVLEKRVRERTAELEAANNELEAFCSSAGARSPHAVADHHGLCRRAARSAREHRIGRREAPHPDDSRWLGQMSELINDLLAFSKLGRQALSRQMVNLDRMCRDVFKDLESERGERRVEWRLQPLPPADGDPALLRVVFVNLLSNALKYSRPRDVAVIEIGVLPETSEGLPIYFVRDNGVGFDMRDAEKLFGVFQRLHHAHEFEGTGVGLATVRRIVDRHGGRIWAEAAPGAGRRSSSRWPREGMAWPVRVARR